MTVANRLPTADPRKILTREFAAVGLSKDAIQALPEWWEEAVGHPSGVYEVRGFAAKHFGLEIGPNGQLRQRLMPHACFKTRIGTDITEVASARALATAVASIIAAATVQPLSVSSTASIVASSLPPAVDIRHAVLGSGRPWVGLSDLLGVCWGAGIPVVYLPSLPVSKPKMEGMVTFCGGRPVILVTTRKAEQPAWMLFVLAHEMGHVALGHLDQRNGGTIMDESVSEDDTGLADPQEVAANVYALHLLNGETTDITLGHLMKPTILAEAAVRYGREHGIDPGHVVLKAVRNTSVNGRSPWGLGANALKLLDHEASSSVLCRDALRRNVNLDALSDDSFEFLERLGVL